MATLLPSKALLRQFAIFKQTGATVGQQINKKNKSSLVEMVIMGIAFTFMLINSSFTSFSSLEQWN